MEQQLNIYTIYTSEDNDTMLRLVRHLNPLKEFHDISIWHDDPILSGQQWKPRIESRLRSADIFLLLVSDAFMHSEFINQLEFKMVIDRYKEGESTVIPILIDKCPWDIDFKSEDYDFSLKELQVLPEGKKPIGEWKSPDEAFDKITATLGDVIASIVDDTYSGETDKSIEENAANTDSQDQIGLNFPEEEKANKIVEEGNSNAEEIELQKGVEEEKRLIEEAKDKKRAEQEKRILEEAEAKSKAEEKEKKRKEEAEVKKKTEEEKRLSEKVEAQRIAEEEKKRIEKAEVDRRNEEEKRLFEETEAQKRVEEEKKRIDEKRRIEQSEAKRRAEEKKRSIAEAEARRRVEQENIPKEITHQRLAAETDSNVEETPMEKNPYLKKRVLIGALIAVLAVVGIWTFSTFNSESEKEPASLLEDNATDVRDSITSPEAEIEPVEVKESLPELVIGDIYNGGFIFSIASDGKSGKIAHLDDAGPMSWQDAMIIHDQLGAGWRLPTLEELKTMYQTIGQGATNSGEFSDGLYWSATAYDEYQARLLKFSNGNSSYHYNKENEQRKFWVRAIRDFSR